MENQKNFSEEVKELGEGVKANLSDLLDEFYSFTSKGHVINYNNGFLAVGIYEKYDDTVTEPNQILIYSIGLDRRGNNVKEFISIDIPEEEAIDLLKCLKIVLEKKGEKKQLKK